MADYIFSFFKRVLHFKKPAGTSRGYLTEKPSWIIICENKDRTIKGLGECSFIPGLSPDYSSGTENDIHKLCQALNEGGDFSLIHSRKDLPALRFGFETALLDARKGGTGVLFETPFSKGESGIPINGLIWMGYEEEMLEQAKEKIRQGFSCLKFKIGAFHFEKELQLLKKVRANWKNIEIRLDANGAFTPQSALEKLKYLSDFDIHSIEQPIKPGQLQEMARLCEDSPVPVALDEELIEVCEEDKRKRLIEMLKPAYIILKPSLLGGMQDADEWIELAENNDIGWWATSALESNIGLNAIAQWVSSKKIQLPQGLGTGALFKNNFDIPLSAGNGMLFYGSRIKGEGLS